MIILHFYLIKPQVESYADILLYKTPLVGYLIEKFCRISFHRDFIEHIVRINLTRSDKEYKIFWHRFILGETRLYNLLLADDSPAASKTFRGAGLSSSASKSVKRSGRALKRREYFGLSYNNKAENASWGDHDKAPRKETA